jgi:hypothetical protein
MCLRAHRYLTDTHRSSSGTFVCADRGPECPGGETYALRGAGTSEAKAVDDALDVAWIRFHKRPNEPPVLWLVAEVPGGSNLEPIPPESTHDLDRHPVIYLTGRTADQLVFQAAHEVFHLLFTPVPTHHWLHELVAVVFSLDCLQATGRMAYLAAEIRELEAAAAALSLEELFKVDEMPYPPGLYGRATVFGRRLMSIVGPTGYKGLATSWTPDGKPDYWRWVDTLPTKLRRALIEISPRRDATR